LVLIDRRHRFLEPMRLHTRPLYPDDPQALALAQAAGAHGIYVHNALAAGDGDGFVFGPAPGRKFRAASTAVASRGEPPDDGLAWFGPRGNLVVLARLDLEAAAAAQVTEAIMAMRLPWRIAMGPRAVIEALRECVPGVPLVHREQVYYEGSAATAAAELRRFDVRPAERADRDRLILATLQLNHSDLNLDPARVDRRWLRSTRVLGPIGGPWCKLDLGSDGPGGAVIEGVFTFAEHRGKGLAAALVASCLLTARDRTILHVGHHNRPARAAYERAGMVVAGSCRLLLLG
jgi:GNAT superfamily N-acetyltransferase